MVWLLSLTFLLLILPPPSSTFLITGYDFRNATDDGPLSTRVSEVGETFKVPRAVRITTVDFLLFTKGNPTMNVIVVLYDITSGISNREPIARSLAVNASLIPGPVVVSFRDLTPTIFTFSSTPLVLPGRDYAAAVRVEFDGINDQHGEVHISLSEENGFSGVPFQIDPEGYHVAVDDFVFAVFGRVPSSMNAAQ